MEFSGLLGVDGLFKRIPAAHIVQQPWQIRWFSNDPVCDGRHYLVQ